MKKYVLLSVLLLLGACSHVDPSLTDQTIVYADAKVRRSELVVAVAPKAKSHRPMTALCYPFHVQQSTPDYRQLGHTFASVFYGEWMRHRLFPVLEYDEDLVYYSKRRALAEARHRGADLLVLGFVPYFYAGATLDDTALTIQTNIYDTKTGILLFSMAQSGRIEARLDEDWVYFKLRTRMSDSPFTKLLSAIAADMTVPLASWLPHPDTPYGFAENERQIVNALTRKQPAVPPQTKDSLTPKADSSSSQGKEAAPSLTSSTIEDAKDGTIMERDLSQTSGDVPGINLDIKFDVDKATIKPESYPLLDELGKALTSDALKDKKIIVAGHTDSTADDKYNLKLSVERARAVKKYLVLKYAVRPNHIETVGYGERRPVADNGTAEGRRKNRRVEVRLAGD